MPTPTYIPLANITLSATATSVTFSSIPATYRDLILVATVSSSISNTEGRWRLNGDVTAGTYPGVQISGDGTTASAASFGNSETFGYINSALNQTNAKTQMIFQIFDYSLANKHKSILQRTDSPATNTLLASYRWANTAVVNQINFFLIGAPFAIGSTFALYGIAG